MDESSRLSVEGGSPSSVRRYTGSCAAPALSHPGALSQTPPTETIMGSRHGCRKLATSLCAHYGSCSPRARASPGSHRSPGHRARDDRPSERLFVVGARPNPARSAPTDRRLRFGGAIRLSTDSRSPDQESGRNLRQSRGLLAIRCAVERTAELGALEPHRSELLMETHRQGRDGAQAGRTNPRSHAPGDTALGQCVPQLSRGGMRSASG